MIPVRTRPHRTVPAIDIIIGERVRGVVSETLPELVDSIRQLGLLYPVLIDETSILIDGEQRLAALAELGVTDIPVIIDSGIAGDGEAHLLAERMRRELASNGVRTSYTPVQAAAARRRLRELVGRAQYDRSGATLAERRKSWASELATSETGISRTTMDRVDKIVRIAEDDAQPMSVRLEAAEGLTRIDEDGVAVDRVLKEVQLTAAATAAVERYPALAGLPSASAQVNMADHLDTLPDEARATQLTAMAALWTQQTDLVASFQLLQGGATRIDDLLTFGAEVIGAVTALRSAGHLTTDTAAQWNTTADRLEALAHDLRAALSQEDHS